jgi:hypothetical protein
LNIGPIGCSETSARNYHYTLRKNPEERRSQACSTLRICQVKPYPYLMCIGPCIIVIKEEELTRRYLVFYYTYERLNMFRAALCPSSGVHDYIYDYQMDLLILSLLMVGG